MTKKLKILIISLILVFTVVFLPRTITNSQDIYNIEVLSEVSETILGVTHKRIVLKFYTNGISSSQTINTLEFNPKTNPNLHIISGDDYQPYNFAPANLKSQAVSVNKRYFNQVKVVAGTNGDFYNTSIYHSSMAFVRNYEVIYGGHSYSPGATSGRILIGFKENGEVIIDRPTHGGYKVFVEDKDGARKDINISLDGYNKEPENEDEVVIYFDNYGKTINNNYPKLVFEAAEIKNATSGQYFAKGRIQELTTNSIEVPENQFVLVGSPLLEEGLITEEDTVIVSQTLLEPYNDIRFAVGGNPILVEDGVYLQELDGADPYNKRPRSSLGLKEDGTVMLVTVDGDQGHIGLDGLTMDEMAYLMFYLGLDKAVNIDGGGSTTMVGYNNETDSYDLLNSPSVPGMRSNSNAIFIVEGQFHQRLPAVSFPDLREILDTPENVHVTFDGKIYFDEVTDASFYEIIVDGLYKYRVNGSPAVLNINPGNHSIEIKAFGNFETKRPSYNSSGYSFFMHSDQMNTFLNGLLDYANQANQKQED